MLDLAKVRTVIGPDDLGRIGEFRYRIYVEEQAKCAAHANHQARTLIEPADRSATATVYWIECDGEVIGTVRAEVLGPGHEESQHLRLDCLDFIAPRRIIHFTRLMIARKARHSDAMATLCFVGFQKGIVNDCWVGVLTCIPALVPLFERYGYSQYAKTFVHPESGLQVPMAIVGEPDYLAARAAPLTTWLVRYRSESPYTPLFLECVAKFRASLQHHDCRERTARGLVA